MEFIKRKLPFVIIFLVGLYSFIYYFVPHKHMQASWEFLTDWTIVIGGVSLLVGVVSLVRVHYKRMMTKSDPNRFYSVVAIVSMIAMAAIGFIGGIGKGSLFDDFFKHLFVPLDATMFSLLAFYMSSASFRAFRMRNREAGILLVSALLVMLAQIPLGEAIWSKIPVLSQFILDYPNMAAQRAITIGIGIGAASTALKIVLGIERSMFGGLGGGK